MWYLDEDAIDKKGIAKYGKLHQKEVELCFANLDRMITWLNSGMTLQQAAQRILQ